MATQEFAAHGLAGTRVDTIAQKAGCNKQLIYYYFKSKENLYDEVLVTMMAQMRPELPPLRERGSRNLFTVPAAVRNPNGRWWLRLLTWEALGYNRGKIVRGTERSTVYRREIQEILDLQRRDELDPDLDPDMLLVVIHALRIFPFVFPQMAKMSSGLEPDSREFSDRYSALLTALAEKLAPTQRPRTVRWRSSREATRT